MLVEFCEKRPFLKKTWCARVAECNGGDDMQRQFTLEYWLDDDWYVGKLKEVPGVFSQGETLAELEDNIKDAYALVMADEGATPRPGVKSKEIAMDIA